MNRITDRIAAGFKPAVLPLVVFSVVASAFYWRALVGPDLIVSDTRYADWTTTLWAYWWTGEALLSGTSPFASTETYYPIGQSPLFMYNLLDTGFAAPLVWIAGPRMGYNLFALATLISTAAGGFWLARTAGASRLGALIAGLSLETSSYVSTEIMEGRISQALLLPTLLALVGLLRLCRGEQSRWWVVGTGLAFAATALAYWYYGLFLLLAAVPLILATIRRWDRARALRVLVAGAIGLLLCLPFVVSLAHQYRSLPGVERQLDANLISERFGEDDHNLYMANNDAQWVGWPLTRGGPSDGERWVALLILLLAAIGLFKRGGQSRWRWAAMAAIGYVLALGPFLIITPGQPTRIPMPFLLLHHGVPFFERMWWPARAIPVFLAGLSVLAALGFDRSVAMLKVKRSVLLALAVGTLLAEILLRSNAGGYRSGTLPHYDEDVYSLLDGALITTPVFGDANPSRFNLWLQVNHGLPILSGNGDHLRSHLPPGFEDYVLGNTLLQALAWIAGGATRPEEVTPDDVQALLDDGFRWVVVDDRCQNPVHAEYQSENYRRFLGLMWGPIAHEGDGVEAWPILPIDEPRVVPDYGTMTDENF